MKFLIATLAMLLTANAAHAFEANCKATAIYDESFFEESFSLDEYPEVTVTPEEVMFGSSLYSLENGDVINVKPSFGFKKIVEVSDSDGYQTFVVTVNDQPNNRTGTITAQEKGKEPTKLADLICE